MNTLNNTLRALEDESIIIMLKNKLVLEGIYYGTDSKGNYYIKQVTIKFTNDITFSSERILIRGNSVRQISFVKSSKFENELRKFNITDRI